MNAASDTPALRNPPFGLILVATGHGVELGSASSRQIARCLDPLQCLVVGGSCCRDQWFDKRVAFIAEPEVAAPVTEIGSTYVPSDTAREFTQVSDHRRVVLNLTPWGRGIREEDRFPR